MVQKLGIQQSMSRADCPWENGYQESFYKGFKQDLGDPTEPLCCAVRVLQVFSKRILKEGLGYLILMRDIHFNHGK